MKLSCDIMSADSATVVDEPTTAITWSDDSSQFLPLVPKSIEETGIEEDVLIDLALKLAYTVPRFTTEWAAENLCLNLQVVSQLLDRLRSDKLIEVLGQIRAFNYRFAITQSGRERAKRLTEICGYVGPAPVSLETYTRYLQRQFERLPQPTPESVNRALADMVVSEESKRVAGLALMSRRSLFLHGPPGNGKTTLGHLLHDAIEGELWLPHCIGIEHNIVRVFDREIHEVIDQPSSSDSTSRVDRRWVCVKRPFVVVGGELTIEAMDLIYSEALRFYEAPLHFKANGGTFLLDDFGCQRVDSQMLVNRWIHPLERQVDFLTLRNGQQLAVPFQQMLIVSTNLDPAKVMSPAFMRRMGYRIYLGTPSEAEYTDIFQRYASRYDLTVTPSLIDCLRNRYQTEGRQLRSCEPRDLIERSRDICKFQGEPPSLNERIVDLAWKGYFGVGALTNSDK